MKQFEHLPVLTRIRTSYNQFSEKEKLIADYILNNSTKIIHFTINQVSEDLNIADATVFRFCKRIGFKGYQAMKIALASETNVSGSITADIHETISEDDSEVEVASKVCKTNMRAIEETLKALNAEDFKKAVDLMVQAGRVEFYGNGGSGIIALDAHHKFLRTGLPTIAYNDTHMQLISASQLNDNDVAVLISHSGANTDILDVLEVIKSTGAKTIGITHLARSPLSSQVDVPLFTVSQETEYRTEALASRIAELSIIDALYVNVSKRRKQEMGESLQKLRRAISIKRL
jgi:RpiR family carbohydrate utilization transcriptional regulator